MDRNQNQGNQSWRSDQDWNETRRRFNQRNDLNQGREEYGSSGYGGYNQGRGSQSGRAYRGMEGQSDYDRYSGSQDYRRTNYMPDNDENRYESDRDYESNQYGTSGTYGYRGSSSGYNQGMYSGTGSGYGSMGSSSYGSSGSYGSGSGYGMGEGSDYGRQSSWRERQGMSGYGDYGGGAGRAYGEQYRRMSEGRGYRDYDRDYERSRRYGQQGQQGQQDRGWWDRTRDEVSSWFGDEDAERRRDMDRYYEGGGYRGKGPKSYQRSEERIKEDICDRFTDDDMLDATDIDIEVHGHEVVLTGTVNNRMQKRRAEDLAESISGVQNVENRIHVGRSNVTLTDSTEGTSGMLTRESREKKLE
jgi:osmotically-inducible protein OsmY